MADDSNEEQVLAEYSLNANGMPINVRIAQTKDYVPIYITDRIKIGEIV